MKKLIWMLTLVVGALGATAQTVSVQHGAASKEKIEGRSAKILSYDKASTVVVNKLKKELELLVFDNELALTNKYPVKLPAVNKVPHEYIDAFGIDGKLMFITRVYNKVDNRLTHYAYKLNADGTYDAEPIILDEIEGKPGEEIKVQHSFALTSDRKLLYMLRTLPNEKGASSRYLYRMWDNEFRDIANRTIAIPIDGKRVEMGMIIPDGSSNLYFTARVEDLPNPKKRIPELPYYWTVFNYDVDDDKILQYPLALGSDMFVYSTAIHLDKGQEKLHASGFYGANAKGGITGCFITTTDIITNQVLRKTTEPINKEFANIHKVNLKKFRDTNIPKKLIRGVMDVEPTQVLTREDGNVFLVGEITRTNKEVPSGQKPDNFPDEKSKITNYVQGVIVVNFNARGSIDWQATLSLNQMTMNDEGNGNSFVRGVLRDKIALLYNDNPVNVDQIDPVKQLPMERTGGKYSRGLIAYVDKYGKTDVEVLFAEKEEESVLHPYSAYSIARNQQLVLATSTKGTLKLVKVTFY